MCYVCILKLFNSFFFVLISLRRAKRYERKKTRTQLDFGNHVIELRTSDTVLITSSIFLKLKIQFDITLFVIRSATKILIRNKKKMYNCCRFNVIVIIYFWLLVFGVNEILEKKTNH